jgi:hypothetical protein
LNRRHRDHGDHLIHVFQGNPASMELATGEESVPAYSLPVLRLFFSECKPATISIAAMIETSMITWRDGRSLLSKHYSMMRLPTSVFHTELPELVIELGIQVQL